MHPIRRFIDILHEADQPAQLFHTSSGEGVYQILKTRTMIPKDHDSFVSFSAHINLHDISFNHASIAFAAQALAGQIEEVEYSEDWAETHRAQSSYIAGEGWTAQYEPAEHLLEPPDDADDFWEPDDDDLADDYRLAEINSFLWKSEEAEFISRTQGQPVTFEPQAVQGIIVHDGDVAGMQQILSELGYHHVSVSTGAAQP